MPDHAAALPFTDVPLIDARALIANRDYAGTAAALHDAATRVGFFYLTGHGIPEDLMARAFAATRGFFALPSADKTSVAVDTNQRGWMAEGMATMEGAATHDLKEIFFWGREIAADDPDLLAGKPLVARNRWPEAVYPELRREIAPYYLAVCGLAREVLKAVAMGFGAAPNFFEARYAKPLARGQLVYYPPSAPDDEAAGRFGVAPHSDFGVMTFLLQDDSGGLQVQNRAGDWIAAPPIPGSLVCNIGDLLQRWSNDRFVSTRHRVINRSGHERYSIPVFFDPDSDAVIDPRDLNLPDGTPPRYDPVTAGAHIMGRNVKAFAQYKA